MRINSAPLLLAALSKDYGSEELECDLDLEEEEEEEEELLGFLDLRFCLPSNLP